MGKLLVLLMIILLSVTTGKSTLFDADGIHKDAVNMKNSTQMIIEEANNTMETFNN
ncbi:hypothetical protein [Anaerobacillus arseniciselenatis]|uniref:hypothetical protein n=1 Tax=Anaerobacillus arseniciselenatis TaxID=85682 RepID=UPI001471BC7F|nr:hypothetical protein [Anaerobacillus arseniciselenatis]